MIKAFVSVTISDIVLMFPVGMLYFLVKDYMGGTLGGRGGFYLAGSLICLALIAITTYIQYNATFFATYVESGVRRITLAEKLRKIPLSFFWQKRSVGSDQHDHGGLCDDGDGFFPCDTGTDRSMYFYGTRGIKSLFL